MSKRCAIIGAGASGLVAAIEAARAGLHVKVFEKNTKCGRKLLTTGNGRCNITNLALGLEHFHSNAVDAVARVLAGFDAKACMAYFKALGVEIVASEGGKCFPMSFQARTVVEMLTFTCKALGVEFVFECEVLHVKKENGVFILEMEEGAQVFDVVLVATGGASVPTLGSSASGLVFAKHFGHRVQGTFPSLVQLVTKEDASLASGVKWCCEVSVVVDGRTKGVHQGDVLFASYGLSGLAILDASREVVANLALGRKVAVCLDLFPSLSKEALKGLFQKRANLLSMMPLVTWLEGVMHHKLARLVLEHLGLHEASTLDAKTLNRLVHGCKRFEWEIKESKGYATAEVMAGGVAMDEIDPLTMGSCKVGGLYFSGEVLDVDGDCGGYNLHFAWASGIKAGRSMAC